MKLSEFLQHLDNPEDLSVNIEGSWGVHFYSGPLEDFSVVRARDSLSLDIGSITINKNMVSITLEA